MVVAETVGGFEAEDGAPWPFASAWDVAMVYWTLAVK
jgi:hypothetical protein